jgi:hypothetical protein
MDFFTIIPEAQGIILSSGVYRQVALYQRSDRIYAKHGSGFVRLNQGCSTSHAKIRWVDLDTPNGKWAEDKGYVVYQAVSE